MDHKDENFAHKKGIKIEWITKMRILHTKKALKSDEK